MTELVSPLKKVFYAAILTIIVLQIVVLSPTPLEIDRTAAAQKYLDPEEIIEEIVPERPTLAVGIPKRKIPDYSIDDFHFISSRSGQKEWKIVAVTAHIYTKEDIMHGRQVTAYLYDAEGKTTLIEGNEAKNQQKAGILEIFGNVRTTFPDGFTIYSEYMQYQPNIRRVSVPDVLRVWGNGEVGAATIFSFNSMGLNYDMVKNEITLYRNVNMILTKLAGGGKPEEKTTIDSDQCMIDRVAKVAHFTMSPARPVEERFTKMTQPNLFVRSRSVDLFYGGSRGFLRTLVANEDVFIQEMQNENQSLRYATCGQAEMQNDKNIIVLTKYPQVYQDTDTVTGDTIIIYRDTDIVEVKRSNAFSNAPKEF